MNNQPLKVRIKKTKTGYQQQADELKTAWPKVRMKLTEAAKFSDEFSMQLAALELR